MNSLQRTGPRIVEVGSPAVQLLAGMLSALVTAWIAAGVTFLVLLVFGLVAAETGLVDGIDPLLRASLGGVLIVCAVLTVATPIIGIAHAFALVPAIEALHAADREAVPTAEVRRQLSRSPAEGVRALGQWCFWIGLGLVVLFLITVAVGNLWDDEVVWILVGGAAALTVLGLGVTALGDALLRAYDGRMIELREHWERAVPIALAREKTQRGMLPPAELPRLLTSSKTQVSRWLPRIVSWGMGIGAIVLFLSVVLRQPCRYCDQVTWNDPIEQGIDGLSLIGGATLITGGIVLVLGWIGFLLRRMLVEGALRRWLTRTPPSRVSRSRIRDFLTLPTALGNLAATTVFAGTALIVVGLGMRMSGWGSIDPQQMTVAAAILLLTGILLELAAQRRQMRLRTALRDATWPGDMPDAEKVAEQQASVEKAAERRRAEERRSRR